MKRFEIPKVLRAIGQTIVAAPFVALLLAMLLGLPLELALETIDLVRMRERTAGTIDAVTFKRGSKGTSRADIAYHFSAAGRRIDSHRVMPGYFGNHGTWSGGAGLAHRFPVGALATVYYSRGRAELCALEYGWFSWAASLSLLWIGGATLTASVVCLPAGRRQKFVWYAGWASIVYAFGLIFVGPSVVRVGELLWHAVACLGAMLLAGVYGKLRRLTMPPQAMQPGARQASVESRDPSQSPTVDLVLGLVFLIAWTAAATAPLAWMLFSAGLASFSALGALLLALLILFGWLGWRGIRQVGRELLRRSTGR